MAGMEIAEFSDEIFRFFEVYFIENAIFCLLKYWN